MREIKYRVWIPEQHSMLYKFYVPSMDLNESLSGVQNFNYWELMQYTGQKDKNGKEIWEGDILSYIYDVEVVWDEYNSRFNIKYKNGDLNSFLLSPINWRMHEVIGNIWENPELRINKD